MQKRIEYHFESIDELLDFVHTIEEAYEGPDEFEAEILENPMVRSVLQNDTGSVTVGVDYTMVVVENSEIWEAFDEDEDDCDDDYEKYAMSNAFWEGEFWGIINEEYQEETKETTNDDTHTEGTT
jgi:hypothetical protein